MARPGTRYDKLAIVYRGGAVYARSPSGPPIYQTRSKRSGTGWHEDWSLTALGFLETSLGNYEAALNALEPLLVALRMPSPSPTEIFAASFVPDAVEALTEDCGPRG